MDNKIPNYLLNTIKGIYRNTKVRIKFMMVYLNQYALKQRSKTGMWPFTSVI